MSVSVKWEVTELRVFVGDVRVKLVRLGTGDGWGGTAFSSDASIELQFPAVEGMEAAKTAAVKAVAAALQQRASQAEYDAKRARDAATDLERQLRD